MYLSRLYLKNFRSIESLDLNFLPGKNVIVGRNNSGKSNIISAIDIVLGESSPDYTKSDNISETDFFTKESMNGDVSDIEIAQELRIWCELTRLSSESLDYDALYDCIGFYAVDDIRFGPRRRFELNDIDREFDSIFDIDEDEVPKTYINPKLRNQLKFEQEFDNKYHFAFAFQAARDAHGINKKIRLLYREDESSGWILALRATVRNALIQSAVIPSFRDPFSQLRATSWSWYGKLLRHLTAGSISLPDVQDAFTRLKEAADSVFTAARERIEKSTLSVAFPGTSISFQFSTERSSDIYKNCVIYVDDGFKSLLNEKGSGLQSATIIGLFCYYTKEVHIQGSALMCVEEPELYLHPHARRVLSDRFEEFLDSNRNQVVMSTHSVEFLRTTDADVNVILVQRVSKGPTYAKNISLKQFERLLRDNNQNELFFSDKVVVCEGFDDVILRYAARELYPRKLDENNVSIVSVSGKDNICELVKLVLKLGIRCYVFADFDFLLRDKLGERLQYGAKAHDSIASLPAEFFTQLPSVKDGKKMLGYVNRVRSYLKQSDEQAFYTAKQHREFSAPNIEKLLQEFRRGGLGILNGDLEETVLDQTLLSDEGKVDLASLQQIRARIADGQSLSEFFELSQIREFLSATLDVNQESQDLLMALQSLRKEIKSSK